MIENQMLNYREPRMSWGTYQELQAMYRRHPIKPTDKPCITPVGMKDGGKFHETR